MFTSLELFFDKASNSIVSFDDFCLKHFTTDEISLDHICYKCGDADSFEKIRRLLETESHFIYQSIVSGRRISYIKFKKPLTSKVGEIWYLELSDQKPDRSQIEGFDHIEVVPKNLNYDDLVRKLECITSVIHVERPHHTTDDVVLDNGFVFRCSQGPLIEKIKSQEKL